MKVYNSILICITCIITGFCTGLILWAQPLNGDLTRIGAYPERWYGWNAPQQKIPNMSNTERTTEKKHLLVLGDSFSEMGRWQATLDKKYSFSFVHTRNTNFHKFIEKIQQDKPDGVVIESVERFVYALFGSESKFMNHAPKHCTYTPKILTQTSNPEAFEDTVQHTWRTRKKLPSTPKEISQGFHLVKQRIFFYIKPKKQLVKIFNLTSSSLFSSQRSDQLLVFKNDSLLTAPLNETAISSIRCSIHTLAHTLDELHIPYVLIIVPDKTSAYQPYLAQQELHSKPLLINQLMPTLDIPNAVNMLPAIHDALADNTVDFYLPNDTHWGYKGFQLAAKKIDAALQPLWQLENP